MALHSPDDALGAVWEVAAPLWRDAATTFSSLSSGVPFTPLLGAEGGDPAYFYPILDAGTSLLYAATFRASVSAADRRQLSWRQLTLAFSLAYFGGTSMMAVIFLGRAPGWLMDPLIGLVVWMHFWLVWKVDAVFELLQSRNDSSTKTLRSGLRQGRPAGSTRQEPSALNTVVRLPLIVLSCGCTAHCLTSWSFEHAEQVSTSPVLILLATFVAGTGGGMLMEGLGLAHRQWQLRVPRAVSARRHRGAEQTMILSVLFFILVNCHGWLPLVNDGKPLVDRASAKLIIFLLVLAAEMIPEPQPSVVEAETTPASPAKQKDSPAPSRTASPAGREESPVRRRRTSEVVVEEDLSKLRVAELKERLASAGLSTKGLKRDLLERLQAQ